MADSGYSEFAILVNEVNSAMTSISLTVVLLVTVVKHFYLDMSHFITALMAGTYFSDLPQLK